jgi:hypothetical protein
VTVVARGRDLRTGDDEETSVVDEARLDLELAPDGSITAVTMEPPHPGVEGLVGIRASAGFRRAVAAAMPGEGTSRSVRFQLLDDLPTAVLVSGHAVHRAGVEMRRPGPALQRPDLCAGWVADGTLLRFREMNGRPARQHGPVAPSVDEDDDPLAWHSFDGLPSHGMRRRRRIDVWREDGVGRVEAFFRDSHFDVDGVETIVHEYTVHATVDPATRSFLSCGADIGRLPYPECPNAAASANRLAGAPVDGVRTWVRDTFVGPTTCTHLNDTLRSLEDVGALLGVLEGPP